MLMNYHELTMNERRDSPARRKQFLVICTIMAGMFAHGMFSAGAFNSIDITEGGFPGGFFVYKYAKRYEDSLVVGAGHLAVYLCLTMMLCRRDYASSASLIERIGDDLNVAKSDYGDLLYSLFLDDGAYMSGRTMRYACGILVDKTGQDKKQTLLDMNTEIAKLQKENDNEDPPALELWKLTSYEETSLPSVDSAVLQFPTSNGIVSALVLQYRVSRIVPCRAFLVTVLSSSSCMR